MYPIWPPASFTFHQCSCESSMTSYSAFCEKIYENGHLENLLMHSRLLYYLFQGQVSSFNRLKWVERNDSFQPTWSILEFPNKILNLEWSLKIIDRAYLCVGEVWSSRCDHSRSRHRHIDIAADVLAAAVQRWWLEARKRRLKCKSLATFRGIQSIRLPAAVSWRWAWYFLN